MRTLLSIGFAALLLASLAEGTRVAAAPSHAVVNVVMPGDLQFAYKKGPGQELATTHCLTCHSAAHVSMQPRLDKAHWLAEVTKMRKAYGAEISDADSETIANYLTTAYGIPAH